MYKGPVHNPVDWVPLIIGEIDMTTYKLALSADKKTVYIAKGADAFPGGVTNLPNLVHDDAADPVHPHAANHVLWHHIREVLYKRKASDGSSGGAFPNNITNMGDISIVKHGNVMKATMVGAADVTREGAGTVSPVPKWFGPEITEAGVNAPLDSFTWTSSDPAVATVDAATGVITYVAEGETIITGTEINGGKVVKLKAIMT